MHINIIGYPRTGSQYLQYGLKRILMTRFKNVHLQGEFLQASGKKGFFLPYEERVSKYQDLINDGDHHIFKIFPYQLVGEAGLDDLDKFIYSPNAFNIFLYRENILDTLLSKLLLHITKQNRTRDPNFKDTVKDITYPEVAIEKNINGIVLDLQHSQTVFSKYKFDAVLKYEDFTGDIIKDFGPYIKHSHNLPVLTEGNFPLKMNSFEYKKTLFPYQTILRDLNTALNKAGIVQPLSFAHKGLAFLNDIPETLDDK